MNMNTPRAAHADGLVASPMSRRTLLVSFLAASMAGGLLAACGDDTAEPADTTPDDTTPDTTPDTSVAPGTIEHSADSTAAVIRFGYSGGFIAPDYMFSRLPSLVVAGDGRVYAPGVMTLQYPGPLVEPVYTRTITEAGIQTLLKAADEAGLLSTPAPDYSAELMIADAPNTDIAFAAKGITVLHSAYALGIGSPNGDGTTEVTPARQALLDYSLKLGDLATTVGAEQLGPEEPYAPAAYRVRARVADQSELDAIEPAPTVAPWPASTGLRLADASNCATLTAEAAGTVLAEAMQNTYFDDAGTIYFVAAAVLLPGDPAC